MNRQDQIEKEKEQFYSELIEKADGKKIIIYGASVIAQDVIREIKKREVEIMGCCVSKKELNRKEVEGIPVVQVNEIPVLTYEGALFVIAMKTANQKERRLLLCRSYQNISSHPATGKP